MVINAKAVKDPSMFQSFASLFHPLMQVVLQEGDQFVTTVGTLNPVPKLILPIC